MITNRNQFTTYTPEQFTAVNTVCSISSTGFAEFCVRECPQVFLDFENDEGQIVNGEFENSFNTFAGLCHISENVPQRQIVESFMYDTETFEKVGFASMCPEGYETVGMQACKPVEKYIEVAQVAKQEEIQATVQPTEQPAPLIRSGGAEGIAFTILAGIFMIIILIDSLCKNISKTT
jgi:hypothetical protein